jgi:hypothetical protein
MNSSILIYRKKAKRTINFIFLFLIAALLIMHIRGRIIITKFVGPYLQTHEKISSFDDVQSLRDSLYQVIDDGHIKGKLNHFDYAKRPPFGYPVSRIIKTREAQCAGFARLLYHFLRFYGIPSRPVILYGIRNNQHAVLEFKLNNQWYLIDTSNTVKDITEFFYNNRHPVSYFAYEKNNYRTAPLVNLPYFQLYSYMNITRYTQPLFGVNAYITKPLWPWVTFIYNSVYLFLLLLIILLLGIFNLFIWLGHKHKVL